MLGKRDLGFPSPVFLIVVAVVPVIVLIIRRKWQQSVARSEEVRRLLVSASEESTKAEFEASEEYYYSTATVTPPSRVSVSVPIPNYGSASRGSPVKPQYQCAVCFCPTTTRCAKCKAVRYCSGKCQIVHWRQGHKDECRPFVAATQINNVGDNSNTEVKQTATSAESKSPLSYKGNSVFSTCTNFSAGVTFENLETVKSAHVTSVIPARKSTGSRNNNNNNKKTSNLSDEDTRSGTSSSYFSTDESFGFRDVKSSVKENDDFAPISVDKTIDGFGLGSKKSNDIANLSNSNKPPTCSSGKFNHRDASADNDSPTSKLRESKSSPTDVHSHHAAIYSKVPEKSNDIFSNKSVSPDMSKPRDVSSSPKASDTYQTTVTNKNIFQNTKPVKVVDNDNHKITSCSPQLTEASRSGYKTSKPQVVDHVKPSKLSHQESFDRGYDPTHRYSFKGLFPYEMFIKLYNAKHVELQPFGLKNCGNSCYANAVLQCLLYTPPLTAYLLQGLHSKACEKKGWCFTCEFEGLVMKAKNGISPLSPIRILTHIENIGSNLGHGKEEDAHEFLRYVIDALQSVCIKESRKESLNCLEEETTLIGLTFGGYLRSKIICIKCGGKSEQLDRMMDLTVEIEGDIRTLEEALNKFTCYEILDGENKYKCNRCKSYEKAKKKLTLSEAPNVLTIALKRFQSGKFGKLNKSIRFPEILDMAPYVSRTSDKSPIYSLYGVIVHVDKMNDAFSGHYVSYVKNLQNRWFKFDDSIVKEVDLQHVLTKGAYMLLYARCSPRAPRSIRSSIIHHHHDPRKNKVPPSFVSKSHPIAPWDACSYHPSHVQHRTLDDESSSSENSVLFSESCSCSTESTHRDSSSIGDHISGDWEPDFHQNINLNSSDSDTSSSSSFPSPLYCRLSNLYPSTTNGENDHNKVCRNLDCSCNSCRITNLDRLGGRVTYPTSKPSVTIRRSTGSKNTGLKS